MGTSVADQGIDPLGDRSHYRVSTRIPLIFECIEPSMKPSLENQILSAIDPPTLDFDPGLIAWLDRIEHKLDQLLHKLEVGDHLLLSSRDAKRILLSGSGLSFDVNHELPVDSILLLSFELPGDRTRLVRCTGRVAHSTPLPKSEGYTLGIAFDTIRQSDVDAVVQYTVSVQRHQIRAAHAKDGSLE